MASLDFLNLENKEKANKRFQKIFKNKTTKKRININNNLKQLNIKISYIGELKDKFGIFSQNISKIRNSFRCLSLENKETQTLDNFPIKNYYINSLQKAQRPLEIFTEFNCIDIKKENIPIIRPMTTIEKRKNLMSPYSRNFKLFSKKSENNSIRNINKLSRSNKKNLCLSTRKSNQREKNIEGLLKIKKVSDNELEKVNIFNKKINRLKKKEKTKPLIYRTIITDGGFSNDLEIFNKRIIKNFHKNMNFKPYNNLVNFMKKSNDYLIEESQNEVIKSKNTIKY